VPSHLRLLSRPSSDKPPVGLTPKPARVRLAGIRDEPAVLALLEEDLVENASAIAPVSIKRLTTLIESGTRLRGGYCLVVDNEDAEPVGLAIVQLNQWWWSETPFLQEVVLYVTPEARGGHAGADLLRGEMWLADQLSDRERVWLLSGVTATQRMEAKMRLYGRHMQQVGGFFIYPPLAGGISV
jgi:hypothetical protein